jgi:hypothetical protein
MVDSGLKTVDSWTENHELLPLVDFMACFKTAAHVLAATSTCKGLINYQVTRPAFGRQADRPKEEKLLFALCSEGCRP